MLFTYKGTWGTSFYGEGSGGSQVSNLWSLTIRRLEQRNYRSSNYKGSFNKKQQASRFPHLLQTVSIKIFRSRASNHKLPNIQHDSDMLKVGPTDHGMPQRVSYRILVPSDVPGEKVLWWAKWVCRWLHIGAGFSWCAIPGSLLKALRSPVVKIPV